MTSVLSNSNYTFRSVQSEDFELLSEWLRDPMVSRWYEGFNCIEDLEGKLVDDRIRMQLVLLHQIPIGYVQDYDIHAWTGHHLAFLPKESRGLDTFIGSSDLMGKGHGTKYLKLLAEELFYSGVPALGIDPDPKNKSARRAYKKIGFREVREVKSDWGQVVLMQLFSPID